ncbi:hypothetical protein D3C87_2054940 [compost metagenome]
MHPLVAWGNLRLPVETPVPINALIQERLFVLDLLTCIRIKLIIIRGAVSVNIDLDIKNITSCSRNSLTSVLPEADRPVVAE